MSIDTKALPIWGWIAHHRESGGRPIIADPGRAAMLPSTEGWDVFPVCRVDDAADRLAELEAENGRLKPAEQHDPLAVSDHCGECGEPEPECACDERIEDYRESGQEGR